MNDPGTIRYILRDGSSMELIRFRLAARVKAREYGQASFPTSTVPRAHVTTAFMAGFDYAIKELKREVESS